MNTTAKNCQIWIFVTTQKLKESFFITEFIYSVLLVFGLLLYMTPKKLLAFKFVSQVHRSSRSSFLRSLALPLVTKFLTIHGEPRNPNLSVEKFKSLIGRNIICIKPKLSVAEKGVILIKYSESMPLLPFFCDMERLLNDYTLVYEPSWSGYCTSDILHFTQYKQKIFVLAKQRDDYIFLEQLKSNLIPLKMGPCDWVDPSIAETFAGAARKFDLVLNSNWSTAKRHQVLFKAMAKMPSSLKVVLIGFAWGERTKDEILDLAQYYGVEDQLTIFENISFDKVMEINSYSKIALLLSLKEGSNRAISESLFCDTPAIVLNNHIGGIVENITLETGMLVNESQLNDKILLMLENLQKYTPRKWALQNISCFESTRSLNESLKAESILQGGIWSQDIVIRTNSPNLRYLDTTESAQCIAETEKLKTYIKANMT